MTARQRVAADPALAALFVGLTVVSVPAPCFLLSFEDSDTEAFKKSYLHTHARAQTWVQPHTLCFSAAEQGQGAAERRAIESGGAPVPVAGPQTPGISLC